MTNLAIVEFITAENLFIPLIRANMRIIINYPTQAVAKVR